MTKVFIIVLNFNGGEKVIECLRSLEQESSLPAKIVVVDNGSEDGSLEMIKKNKVSEKIKIIENKKNLGFAAGNNVGIRYALKKGAHAVLLLNQDTVAEKGFLRPLLENPADIVAPVIRFKRKGKWIYDYGGKINWWLGRSWHLEFSTSREVDFATTIRGDVLDYVSGCAMLIKRPVLEKIGFLDEKFFLYFEDVDFCLRAKQAGFKIAVEPKSMVLHKLAEREKRPLRQHFNQLKSNFIFANRWIPWWKRPLAYGYLVGLFWKIFYLGGRKVPQEPRPFVRGQFRHHHPR